MENLNALHLQGNILTGALGQDQNDQSICE
jgi:hypothetical protein